MVGDAVTDIANTFVSSAYGSTGSTLFSSALSGATSGAAIGTAIAPGVGTAVGALAGGAIGLIQGGTQVYEQKDEAFKSYVQEFYRERPGTADGNAQFRLGHRRPA